MQDEDAPALRLGGLSLRVFGAPVGSAPYEDWVDALARVDAPGAVMDVRGRFMRAAELAALHCIEAVLRIDKSCGRRGEIAMTVEIMPDTATQAHRFDFTLDRTALGPAVAAVQRMLGQASPPRPATEMRAG